MVIDIISSNTKIWNINQVVADIAELMIRDENITLDFNFEGPDIAETELCDIILNLAEAYHYDPKRITIVTANQVQTHNLFRVEYANPWGLVKATWRFALQCEKNINKHFGIFVGRSNAPRLHLASHLYKNYQDQSLITYHFNFARENHLDNIGLEELAKMFGKSNLTTEAEFLQDCPIVSNKRQKHEHEDLDWDQMVPLKDKRNFVNNYQDIFVELVCETCYSGNTFFPTEKIWRPMLLQTPFIVQGPTNFLTRLHKMGFKTFNNWWSEAYQFDTPDYQVEVIKELVKDISKMTSADLSTMYKEMQPVLEHNKQRLWELSEDDFAKQR